MWSSTERKEWALSIKEDIGGGTMQVEFEAKYKDLPQIQTTNEEGKARLTIEGNRSVVMALFRLVESINMEVRCK